MVKPAAGVPPMTAGGRRGRFSPGRDSHLDCLPHRSRLRRPDCRRHQGVPEGRRPWLTRGRPGLRVRVAGHPDWRRDPGPARPGRARVTRDAKAPRYHRCRTAWPSAVGHGFGGYYLRKLADKGWFGATLVRRYCDQRPTQRVALVKIPRNERRWRDAGGHHGR